MSSRCGQKVPAVQRVPNWPDEMDRMAIDEAVRDLIRRQQNAGAPSKGLNHLSGIRRALQHGRPWLTAKQRQHAVAAMRIMTEACDRGCDTGCGIIQRVHRNHCFACTRSRKILSRENQE